MSRPAVIPKQVPQPHMIIQTGMESDGSLVLTVAATALTSTNAAEFREQSVPKIAACTGAVVVDCSQLEFIDSTGVGALLQASNMLAESRRPIRLTGVGAKVLASLELMRVHRQFALEPRK